MVAARHRATMAPLTETPILTAIIRNVLEPLEQLSRLHYIRNNTGRRGGVSFGKRGTADLLITFAGKSIHMEVKRGGEWARADQVEQLERHRRAGGYSCVVHSVDEARLHLNRAASGEPSPRREHWTGAAQA